MDIKEFDMLEDYDFLLEKFIKFENGEINQTQLNFWINKFKDKFNLDENSIKELHQKASQTIMVEDNQSLVLTCFWLSIMAIIYFWIVGV